jgi:hypothetical protein
MAWDPYAWQSGVCKMFAAEWPLWMDILACLFMGLSVGVCVLFLLSPVYYSHTTKKESEQKRQQITAERKAAFDKTVTYDWSGRNHPR